MTKDKIKIEDGNTVVWVEVGNSVKPEEVVDLEGVTCVDFRGDVNSIEAGVEICKIAKKRNIPALVLVALMPFERMEALDISQIGVLGHSASMVFINGELVKNRGRVLNTKVESDTDSTPFLTKIINFLIKKGKESSWSSKEVSDGWHTFEELYYHRMILFLTIQKAHLDKSWRSKQHHDGTMFDDSFIVGIETKEGQYSYHYNLKYWDLFEDIKELEKAPEYDGHEPKDIKRLLAL